MPHDRLQHAADLLASQYSEGIAALREARNSHRRIWCLRTHPVTAANPRSRRQPQSGPSMSATPKAPADPISALERGDWRAALNLLRQTQRFGTAQDAMLDVELRTIARSMADRAAGFHVSAWSKLAIASSNLHHQRAALPTLANGGNVIRLALPASVDPHSAALPAFRTVRLIWREQSELAQLRRCASEPPAGLTEDQHLLVLAVVEYLCWVQFDPGTWLRESPDDEAAAVEARVGELVVKPREGLLRSATDVRRLRRPTAGAMTRAVWDRANQYGGLRRLAMHELGRRSEPPWTESKGSDRIPARTGAMLAWRAAQEA